MAAPRPDHAHATDLPATSTFTPRPAPTTTGWREDRCHVVSKPPLHSCATAKMSPHIRIGPEPILATHARSPPAADSHSLPRADFSSPWLNRISARNRTTLWKRGTVKGVTEDMRSNREEASHIRTLDDDQQSVPPTDDFGGPVGKGVLSGTAESNTAVHVRPAGPPRPSSITHPETLHCDLQLHCRLAQMDSCLGQFGTVTTVATTRRS